MRRPKRSLSMTEVVAATALASVLIGIHATELNRQQVELSWVADESRARDALLSAYERLRAGVLSPPTSIGATVTVPAQSSIRTLRVSMERAPAPEGLDGSLVAVRLRAEWKTPDGGTRSRELTTLVRSGR